MIEQMFVKKKYLTAVSFYSKLPFVARDMPGFRQKGQAVMEKIVEQGLLYDFYGELLTEHQRRIYEDVVYHDMSLGEIAEEQGISRQGVHDLIKRCDRILQGYENKLHLVERFAKAKQTVTQIERLTMDGEADSAQIKENLTLIRRLSQELLSEL